MSTQRARKIFPLYILLALMATLAMVLAACTIPAAVKDTVQHTVTVIGKGADDAMMALSDTDVVFSSGSGTAYSVVLYLGGDNLNVTDQRCDVVNNGIGCDLGDVTGSTRVAFNGNDVSVNTTYFRSDVNTPLFFYLRQPNIGGTSPSGGDSSGG